MGELQITRLIMFTNVFARFKTPSKGVRVINQKYLLSLLQNDGSGSRRRGICWGGRRHHCGGKRWRGYGE